MEFREISGHVHGFIYPNINKGSECNGHWRYSRELARKKLF
jgi:hypothetical protein